MKLKHMCPELRRIKKELIAADRISKVIYGYEDRRYRVIYESGRIRITRHPNKRILNWLRDGNYSITDHLYIERG